MKIIAIIPARMAASRFPGKPLKTISGLPMIEHVRRRTQLASGLQSVIVATCDDEIVKTVEKNGGKAIITSSNHVRCTDRIEEAARNIDADIVIMVQGDEPLLIPSTLEALVKPLLEDKNILATNVVHPITNFADITNKNVVKVVLSQQKNIIYYSRAAIPGIMNVQNAQYFKQSGIMAFRKTLLEQYSKMPPTPYEVQESIDMLRLIENNIQLRAVIVDHETQGVDVPEDLDVVEHYLRNNKLQTDIYNKYKDQ